MRGISRPIPLPRRLIGDLMHASIGVPLITFHRALEIGPLLAARNAAAVRPGWAAIFAKAFSVVALDEPILRTLYVKWPRAHLFELPCSIGRIAIARRIGDEDGVLMQKVVAPDRLALADLDALIRHAKTAPVGEVPAFKKMLQVARLPLPLRRLAWWFALANGRQRANHFGSFGISSVSAYGPGALYPITPGPYILSYGVAAQNRIDVVIRFDHRLTDAALIARTMSRLEQVLNTEIAAELAAFQPQAGPKPALARPN